MHKRGSQRPSEHHPNQPLALPREIMELRLLRIPEVATILNVKRSSVYRLIRERGLPTIALGATESCVSVSPPCSDGWVSRNANR
jgi:excisionase family DNA binding protein